MKKVRVRFAPSPTGGLHLGGVRTVLYNYLFAKQHGGDFILRIEDTDQSRYVEGAEQYIIDCLQWCGLIPDEGPHVGGDYKPYRQSERKNLYKDYAEQLVKDGYAYYAFDTPQEIEAMREKQKADGKHTLHYDHHVRNSMKNSLNLNDEEIKQIIDAGTPYVIRIKVEPNEIISFDDMIRGTVEFNTENVDDKVLLKADGMPTYHLAVVVDDYLMKITHAFRGEEWLPSAPVHILLWKYLNWIDDMPKWAHLPLILKPDGNGKLSKRDGDRLGFPVFAMSWTDHKSGELIKGFKELGFLPEAFLNLLAVLGWNDGTEQEIYSLDELIEKFSIERVHHAGAKFDYEKAKWFNHEWIKKLPVTSNGLLVTGYGLRVKKIFEEKGITITDDEKFIKVLELVKDRCTLLTDFYDQSVFFFVAPVTIDVDSIKPKCLPAGQAGNENKQMFFVELIRAYKLIQQWDHDDLENTFKEIAAAHQLKPGELMLPFRIMLVGGKFGPGVFDIASVIGKEETVKRIEKTLGLL
ncbi:MAG: glutamate--tRNA ligase [Bacteroidota bacterium]|nr:glutamate--tRNA ligase [Bacteroidota bacterium]